MFHYRTRTKALLFFIGGLLGFSIDTTYTSIIENHLATQGFLTSLLGFPFPFLPAYGFGLMFIYLIQPFALQQRWFTRLLIFGGSLTVLEFFGGIFSVAVLNQRVWDYSNNFLNFQGHIDVLHAIYWAILGTAVSYFFSKYPPDDWFPKKEMLGEFFKRGKKKK